MNLLAGYRKCLSARREHRQLRASAQQLGQQGRCALQHLLAVVDNKKQAPPSQRVAQQLGQPSSRLLLDA